MPAKTYQPRLFKRSSRRRARMMRRIWILVACVIVFNVITVVLDRMDDTPRWARVSFPAFVVRNGLCAVDVVYKGRGGDVRVNAEMTVIDDETRNPVFDLEPSGEGHLLNAQSRHVSFLFTAIDPNDPNNPMASRDLSTRIRVFGRGKTGELPEIRSGKIEVLDPNDNRAVRSNFLPGWQNILIDAYETGYWRSKLGDRTLVGWGITAWYAVAGVFCLACTGRFDSRRVLPINQIFAWFWWFMAGVLIFMAVNKQLDIQLLLADIGRAFTKNQGWYMQRAPVQIRVLALGACICLAIVMEMAHKLNGGPKSTRFALCGVLVLAVMVVIHMVSSHSIEHALAASVSGISVADAIEILAIGWIAVCSLFYNRTEREEICYIVQ